MIAYKGFNKDLTCTMGKGRFQYEVGKSYKEDSAKCASTGFHCTEEPIEVLSWYGNDSRDIVSWRRVETFTKTEMTKFHAQK